ncbi:MAG TPA: stage V sporulation protein AD [Clostridiales bacterium]|nr:stage V sporulation protein AD [Clostridiales bacterium]
MPTKTGKQTLELRSRPSVAGYAAFVGKKEGEGPLASYFDKIFDDDTLGEATWEKAESLMQKETLNTALQKAGITPDEVDFVFAGDLLNQCIGSTFGLRDFGIPFAGLYGACSTMSLSLGLAAIFVDSGAANCTAAVTSSHFCSAERQFRYPLEYGGQRPPTSQWTVTGAGAVVVASESNGPVIQSVTFGKIVDLGITDSNNMGAAMAPAAADTIKTFFDDTQTQPSDYDLILTGDLGIVGSRLLTELLLWDGIDITGLHNDCGLLIYDLEKQDVHAGGSGCGCSAAVLCSYILSKLKEGSLNNILFCATGALMSPTSSQQGETVPGIAHLVHIMSK